MLSSWHASLELQLWLAFAIISALLTGSVYLVLHFTCAVVICTIERPSNALCAPFHPSSSFWRSPNASPHDSRGLFMSFILIASLLHSCTLNSDRLTVYSKIASPAFLYSQSIFCPILLFGIISWFDKSIQDPKGTAFIGVWIGCFRGIRLYSSMLQVWTAGEWAVVSCLFSIAFIETVSFAAMNVYIHGEYQLVAVSGVLGCLLGCAAAAKIPSLTARATVLVGAPLTVVEVVMNRQHFAHISPPRCLNWLINFLQVSEEGSLFGMSRAAWVLYWGVILVFLLPVSAHPRFATLASTVVMRKWFHFVATVLFVPVTIYSPQLMALAYAVSLGALMVLECLRPKLPIAIQSFFLSFLDADKDKPDKVVVSHMALIAGCALPMWASALLQQTSPLLRLWGVLVLGVGDSFGALVGSSWGKTKWGPGRQKSMEGSLAMFCSMCLCCSFFGESWLPAVLFTTLLEAFTSQIDNLVLPLAGVAVLLLD